MSILLRIFLISLLFTFHFLLFTAPVSAATPESRLDHFLDGLETYSAAFRQQLFNESGEELEQSTGVFYLRRPGMFQWAYYEPYSQMIISNGVTLWIYDEDLEQVIIRNTGDSLGQTPAAILDGNVKIADHYVVIDLGNSDGLDWMELTPRDVDSQFKSIRLGFKGNHLKKMLLFDNLGQKNLITFLDTKRNSQLNIELFDFTPPAGCDVIDERAH
jgi:outer membrane lipoprotein carrier protein